MSKPNISKFTTTSNGTEATIWLYGTIGMSWWEDYSEEEKPNTAKDFVQAFNDLDGKYDRINVRMNSGGGSMYEGLPMITAIRTAKSEVHGYNDGLCASMAADIFMACPHRHMATNAMLMIHESIGATWGNAVAHRDAADMLDKWSDAALNVMAESTGLDKDELRTKYYNGKDNWLTYHDALESNLIEAPAASANTDDEKEPMMVEKAYTTEAKFPVGIQKMTLPQISKAMRMAPAKIEVMAQEITQASDLLTDPTNRGDAMNRVSTTEPEMNIESIQAAIAAGTIDKTALMAALEPASEEVAPSANAQDTPTAPPASPDEEPEILKQLAAQADLIAKLTEKVEQMSAAPGAEQTRTPIPDAPAAGLDIAQHDENPAIAAFTAGLKKAAAAGSLMVER
jgi:ATP-dependent protease ClpP protease subunit